MTDEGLAALSGNHPWRPTPNFRDRLQRKTIQDQGRVLTCVARLITDPRHPGLHTRAMQGHKGVYEVKVDRSLRLTFHWDGRVIVLRNNCRHDETLANP
jgi:hypothetical protein